jgi:hypothetical protein
MICFLKIEWTKAKLINVDHVRTMAIFLYKNVITWSTYPKTFINDKSNNFKN